jgi:putative toxin-antitoxin system antitoxin component (TIGR02293 family)
MSKTSQHTEKNLNFVSEAPTQYYAGNNQEMPIHCLTSTQKMSIVENRISKNYLEHFKKYTNLDYDSLAKVLSVTRATLINKKGDEKFNTTVSEKILALADLYSFGYEVFEDKEKFNQWMFFSNQALGGSIPFDFLHNQYGREEINNLIGRVAYGVYS